MVDLLRPIANPRLRMRRWISRIPRLIAATSSSGTGEDDNAGEGAMMGCTTASEERDATEGAMTGLMAKGTVIKMKMKALWLVAPKNGGTCP